MPVNSFIVTFTQPLPEEFVIDNNRDPLQRLACAIKRANGKRGLEPKGADDIEIDPPKNDPDGYTLVSKDTMQVPWGNPATCFIYKKFAPPAPEANDDADGANDDA